MEINTNSGQVEIISADGRVYLYTYNTASSLVNDVYQALSEGKRWDDADYLSRIVFCKMIPHEAWNKDNGFGIGSTLYADVNILVTLDIEKQVITIQSAMDKHFKQQMFFAEFIKGYTTNAMI